MDLLSTTALKARDGDRVALEGFLRLVQADVWRTCRYLVDIDAADDLAQEVLVRVVGSLHRLTPEHQVRGWILGIARHVCFDEIRRRQRRRRTNAEFAALRPQLESDLNTGVTVRDLVGRLDDERREAFVLTQLVGMTYEEAAEICGCAIGTIRSRVARARVELQGMVEVANGENGGTLPPPQATGSV